MAPLDEYTAILKEAWANGILTHNGPLVQRFEEQIGQLLGLKNFVAVTNGTVALQMAIKALGLKGEIITTPFTWIASVSAIQWEGCEPVFCDIDPHTLNIDPLTIEEMITPRTTAIIPVHVFGNPCDVKAIDEIAKRKNLRVIYDAAHALGSTLNGSSLLESGDISATSLHATKLLNTAEGGGCVAIDPELHEKLKRIRFFGYDESKDVIEEGFNGKMTEVHAALGLANLKYLNEVLADRKLKYQLYVEGLKDIERISFQSLSIGEPNYSYFPVIFESENQLLEVVAVLEKHNVFPRRYFYPSVNTYRRILDKTSAPISEDVSTRILCLPLYWKLSLENIERIISIIREQLK